MVYEEFDMNAYLESADDTTVEVRIGNLGAVFEYPLTASEFWERISELEDEAAGDSESATDG